MRRFLGTLGVVLALSVPGLVLLALPHLILVLGGER